MIKAMLLNWFTSLFGGVAGVAQVIEGLTSVPKNWALVVSGLATIILGLTAKDSNVTGGTVKQ
jgi:uncharacterized membrane protein HdeD (DUF308 family)